MFPLQFTNLLGKVDLVATVTGAGLSSSAGAIRLATALALRSFVDEHMRERMRLGEETRVLIFSEGFPCHALYILIDVLLYQFLQCYCLFLTSFRYLC